MFLVVVRRSGPECDRVAAARGAVRLARARVLHGRPRRRRASSSSAGRSPTSTASRTPSRPSREDAIRATLARDPWSETHLRDRRDRALDDPARRSRGLGGHARAGPFERRLHARHQVGVGREAQARSRARVTSSELRCSSPMRGRRELRLEARSRPAPAASRSAASDVEHRRLDAGADVVGAAGARRRRRRRGWPRRRRLRRRSRGSAAVAEDGRRLARQQPLAEDGDHAGLAVRVLARAVDVGVAQRPRREAVAPGSSRRYSSPQRLRTPYGGHRAGGASRRRDASGSP